MSVIRGRRLPPGAAFGGATRARTRSLRRACSWLRWYRRVLRRSGVRWRGRGPRRPRRAASSLWKRSKMRSNSSSGMPTPVSETASSARSSCSLTPVVTLPPFGVYFTALPSDMEATWRMRPRSKVATISWSGGRDRRALCRRRCLWRPRLPPSRSYRGRGDRHLGAHPRRRGYPCAAIGRLQRRARGRLARVERPSPDGVSTSTLRKVDRFGEHTSPFVPKAVVGAVDPLLRSSASRVDGLRNGVRSRYRPTLDIKMAQYHCTPL
jgi:hypothetical protein